MDEIPENAPNANREVGPGKPPQDEAGPVQSLPTAGSPASPKTSSDLSAAIEPYYDSLWRYFERLEAKLDQIASYEKPILTLTEAAAYIGVGVSRFRSIMYEYHKKHRKYPDFICNARGAISYRVDRVKLTEWVCQTKRKPGRQPKRSEFASRPGA